MGAVWPFVTGFLALGHYQYERPWAGYPLVDALAHLAFDWARGRHPELLSGAFYRPLDTAVPHQFFATSMLASSIAYGLVGWEPDAPGGRARLAPQLPPQWERARVSGLRAGRGPPRRGDRAGPGAPLAAARAPGRAVPSRSGRRWPAGARERGRLRGRVASRDGGGRRNGRGARRAPAGRREPAGPAACRSRRRSRPSSRDSPTAASGCSTSRRRQEGGRWSSRDRPAARRRCACVRRGPRFGHGRDAADSRARGPRPTVPFPPSSTGPFTTAEVRLHRALLADSP